MEPLKRFTQCGSLSMLFAVFIVLFGVSSTALTTFGKSPPNPPPAPTQPPVKARECVSHNDCSSLRHTSCVRDGSEYRCLCGNNKPPLNGGCDEAPKQLRHLCQEDKHCDDDLICGYENVTRTTGFNRGQNTANAPKICLCDEGNGYTEDLEDNECNHIGRLIAQSLLIISLYATYEIFASRIHM